MQLCRSNQQQAAASDIRAVGARGSAGTAGEAEGKAGTSAVLARSVPNRGRTAATEAEGSGLLAARARSAKNRGEAAAEAGAEFLHFFLLLCCLHSLLSILFPNPATSSPSSMRSSTHHSHHLFEFSSRRKT